jgi:prepilin-type N-terminal cleavage/methylation domain-containing protein
MRRLPLVPAQSEKSARCLYNNQAGLTLIEVLIAMIILAVGIYAVMRIFPIGFDTIDIGRRYTVAATLAGSQLERSKLLADQGNLPDAIVATDKDGLLLMNYDPNSLLPAQMDTVVDNANYVHNLWQPDSVSWSRTVLGERFVVPTVTFPVYNYFLEHAPVTKLPQADNSEFFRVYYANPFAEIDSAATPATNSREFKITGGNQLVVSNLYDSAWLRIAFSYRPSANVVCRMVGDLFQASSGTVTLPYDPLPGSVSVYQALVYTTPGTIPSRGTYTIDPNTTPMTGRLIFNKDEATNEIKVDYRVADWSILHEDVVIPANREVHVGVTPVKAFGYSNPPRQSHHDEHLRLKYPKDPAYDNDPLGAGDAANRGNSLVAVVTDDPSDAEMVGMYYGDDYASPTWVKYETGGTLAVGYATKLAMLARHYRTGRIEIPADLTHDPVGRTLRIFYRAERDWGVQVFKAATVYNNYIYSSSTFQMPDESHYIWCVSVDPANFPTFLCFGRNEAGKTVNLTYYDTNGNLVSELARTITTIPDTLKVYKDNGMLYKMPPGDLLSRDKDIAVVVLDPRTSAKRPVGDPIPDPNKEIKVVGLSVAARTYWAGDGGSRARGFALPDPTNQNRTFSRRNEYLNEAWAQVNLSTFLTPAAR